MSELKHQKLIESMTLEQKASLMSGKDFWQSKDIPEHGIPSMFLADGPHGIRKQAVAADHLGLNPSLNATCFPTAAAMANSFNPKLGEEMGTLLGKEAVAQRVNILLGPGTNIKRNPLCGRNFEYFSEDPYLAGKMASSYIRGIQKSGISACIKHYAANNQELRRMVIDSIVDRRALNEIYLMPFEMAVKEGKVKTVMSAYNKVNGYFANENYELMVKKLREEWKHKGIVVTDWGGDNDRVEGLKCGNELEMPTTAGETNKDIIRAVKEGRLDEKVLDEAVDRLLNIIFETSAALKDAPTTWDIEAHHDFARRCSEESIVLLKNEGNALPLAPNEKIAIIGDFAKVPRYQGAGSSKVNPTKLENTLELIGEYAINYKGFAPGFHRYGKKKPGLIKQAKKLAESANTLLVYLGLDEVTEAEGMDRENMRLPQNQIDLLKELSTLGKRIVVVLSCGSAIEMEWTDYADAVVHASLSGQAGASAVLNILFGRVNPSGKLAESYPIRYEDCSSAPYFPGRENTVEYRESIFVGYRYYDTAGVEVKYPFGYGLSYTTFTYSDLNVSDKGVTFKIKNVGRYAGAEVAQMYVGKKDSKLFRPAKELKGFEKVNLQPGEEAQVEILFDDKTFRYYNVDTQSWEIEDGTYEIYIGSSSKDIRLTGTTSVKGTSAKIPYDKEKLAKYYACDIKNISTEEFEALYGEKVPPANFEFYKKNRMVVGYNTTVAQLRYARGWTGRFFAWAIRAAIKLLRAFGNREAANTLIMGVMHQPMRGLSRMTNGAISWAQLDGMITMFNGKFFKGLGMFMKAGREKKRERKAMLKAQKAAQKTDKQEQ